MAATMNAAEKRRTRYAHRLVDGVYEYDHRRIAAAALGKPLPPGAEVHHHTDQQLVILSSHAEHFALERRTRVLRAGGDPFRDAYCSVGKHTAPIEKFWRRKNSCGAAKAGDLATICRNCCRLAAAARKARLRATSSEVSL